MDFSEWLQKEIVERGWDQSELARRSGLSTGSISNVLNGMRQAGPDFCIGIARALGLPREEVFRARGWLLREPEQIVPPSAPLRVIEHMQRLTQYSEDIRDLILDAYDAVEESISRSAGLKEGKGGGQKNFSSKFATQVSRVGSIKNTTVDLSIFPEEDREIIGQLDPAFQEYLAALLKQGEDRYTEAMNYARSGVDAEVKRIQQSQNTLKNS